MNTSAPMASWSTSSGKFDEKAMGSFVFSLSSSISVARSPRASLVFGGALTRRMRHFGPPRSMRMAQGRSCLVEASRTFVTIRPQASASSWAQLMRAQSMPAAIRLSTRSSWDAASGGRVAITRTRGAPLARLPNSCRRLGLELGCACPGPGRARVGNASLAGQTSKRHDQGVERRRHLGLASPQRRQASGRQSSWRSVRSWLRRAM